MPRESVYERTGYRTPHVAGASAGTLPADAVPGGFSAFGADAIEKIIPASAFPMTTGELEAGYGTFRLAAPGDTFLPLAGVLAEMPDERFETRAAFLARFLDRFPTMGHRVPTEGGPA
jgi:hypothetical protein